MYIRWQTSGKVNLCKSLKRLITLPSDTYFKNGVIIPIFIDCMQRNFILTDVMKTGDHLSYEQFIDANTLPNQSFEYTGEYYTLHNYDLEQYDRKLAFIDMRIHNNRILGNDAYKKDLQKRLSLLHQQGFKFILANPWESEDNIRNQLFITGEKMAHVDIPYPYHLWTCGVSWFWSYMYHKHTSFNFNHKEKVYDFLYLNKAPREHRVKLYDILMHGGLLDKSLHTFVGRNPSRRLPKQYELPGVNPKDYPRWGLDQDIYELPYNHTNCSLVSETNDNDYEIFMTEKIWKPIIAGHLFIVHGNYLYLQKLREMGFKTFSQYFDEGYDLEKDPVQRIIKIADLCKEVRSKNWQDIYLASQSLREHNTKTFFDKEKLSLQVNETINLFLEFVDRS
jgi:hypothetical protein